MIVATWVIAFASAASAIIVWWGISKQTKNLERALSVEAALRLEDRFDTPKFLTTRSIAAKALLDRENELEAEDVFDFFDTVGLFVKLRVLPEEIAHSIFFYWINIYWRAGRYYIGAKQKDAAEVWKNFEWLYEKVCAIERRLNPDSEDLKMSSETVAAKLREEIKKTELPIA